MQFEYTQLTNAVKGFIEIMKDSGLPYMYIKNDKFELELGQKYPEPKAMPPMPVPVAGMNMAMPSQASENPAVSPVPSAPVKSITSPIVGTFYAAPAPDKAPFVKVGDRINEGDTVCIVESMKVMNEIQADKSGTVSAIAVKDGEAVEFGQPLIILE